MDDFISKDCSDFLRESYPGLKASHARELVAAYFGYKSHAALLADKYALDFLDQAKVLIPDLGIIHERIGCLKELAPLPAANLITEELTDFLQSEELFTGGVWHCWDVGEFLMEEYLPEHLSPDLDLELEDEIGSVDAYFEEISYDKATVKETKDGLLVTVMGTYSGFGTAENDSTEYTIHMEISIELKACGGRIAFDAPEIYVEGTLVCDDEVGDDEEQLAMTPVA